MWSAPSKKNTRKNCTQTPRQRCETRCRVTKAIAPSNGSQRLFPKQPWRAQVNKGKGGSGGNRAALFDWPPVTRGKVQTFNRLCGCSDPHRRRSGAATGFTLIEGPNPARDEATIAAVRALGNREARDEVASRQIANDPHTPNRSNNEQARSHEAPVEIGRCKSSPAKFLTLGRQICPLRGSKRLKCPARHTCDLHRG